ncbi:DoxX family protein [Puia sp.]|uniref:DoxX family protein n=1 Tax=Puia sp. TaxID=2045100 RepID=UPI002F3F6EC1
MTDNDYVWLFLRVVAGGIIFPYGMQKLLGWFDDFGGGVGVKQTLARMRGKKIPAALGWLIILGQSLGSVALILGFWGRLAAAANFIIFTGAFFVHARDGWTLNWLGKKKGEGVEYFVLLLSVLLVIIIKGTGAFSLDHCLKLR